MGRQGASARFPLSLEVRVSAWAVSMPMGAGPGGKGSCDGQARSVLGTVNMAQTHAATLTDALAARLRWEGLAASGF